MKFQAPQYFWLLWLVAGVVIFSIYVTRAKRKVLLRFAESALLEKITSKVSRSAQRLKWMLVILGLTMAVLALVRPQWGYHWEEVKQKGVDIIVAIDTSASMLARDASTGDDLSRLDRAKREIRDLLHLLRGDRIGLVAFAGSAFVECPLTLDYSAAAIFLDDIDTDLIPVKGTDLAQALRTSLKAFKGGASESKAIILITDGEDNSGQALKAAQEAKRAGVKVFAVGIGKPEGAPIPLAGGGFKKNSRGEMVISKLDETTLQKIALTTGGKYVRSVSGDIDLIAIYNRGIKATLKDKELTSTRRKIWEQRFQWLIAVAILALAIEPFVPERRRS
ncbi:MAG: VWA domain-containing protein [Deltaproteobacteria bacterium]|nr:VWA domain-containing protein [Deltaproteobacteria bacterium]